MAEASPSQTFWENDARNILSALCSEEQLEDVLSNWDTHRRMLLEQIKTECLAKGSDPAERVQEAEIRLIADFHAKVKTLEDKLMTETPKLESSGHSKMEVSPEKSFDVSKTQDPDQNESCVCGKHVILQSQDSDQPSGSWSQVRWQLTTRMESLVSAGVITSKAYREFLKETPLNTRENQQNMSVDQIAQRQWAFNKRIESDWLSDVGWHF